MGTTVVRQTGVAGLAALALAGFAGAQTAGGSAYEGRRTNPADVLQ